MAREKNIDRLHLIIYTLIRFDLITIYEQSKCFVYMFEDCKFQLENKDMNVRLVSSILKDHMRTML
jgi:hypothetical protein